MWIPRPRTNTTREHVETPYVFQTSFLEAMLGELGRFSSLETRHGSFPPTLRRRILHSGYIAWWILRRGTLGSPAGMSFDPSVEGAMQLLAFRYHLTSALVSPSCQRTIVLVRVVTHSAAVV